MLAAVLWSVTGLTGCDQRPNQASDGKSSSAGPMPAPAGSGSIPMPMAQPNKDAPPMPTMSSTGPGPVPSFAGAASQAGGPVPMMQAGPKP